MLPQLALLFCLAPLANACAGGGVRVAKKIVAPPQTKQVAKPPVPQPPPAAQAPPGEFAFTGSAVADHLGPAIRLSPYNSEGYIKAGGGPSTDLSCNFDEPSSCCWSNPKLPVDQLNWQLGNGAPVAALLKTKLGADVAPSGGYLVLGTQATAAADEAQLIACTVECSRRPVKITLKHWQTYEALVQVCTKSSLQADAPLLNCQELPRESAPGPTTLTLPGANLFDVAPTHPPSTSQPTHLEIVIVASNLVEDEGNVVILDDIEVEMEPCSAAARPKPGRIGPQAPPESNAYTDDYYEIDSYYENLPNAGPLPEILQKNSGLVPAVIKSQGEFEEGPEYPEDYLLGSETTGGAAGSVCSSLPCDFEAGNSCRYVSARGLGYNRDFAVAASKFKNRATGIRRPGKGRHFAATFLRPGGKAGLETLVDFDRDYVVRFLYYEVTQGMQLRACCDSEDACPVVSDLSVSIHDRDWKEETFTCPKGTKKLLFVCENSETNQGACGIDEIRLLHTSKADAC